jgi:hypothetical protein
MDTGEERCGEEEEEAGRRSKRGGKEGFGGVIP